jgi:hypothetical protein
MQYAWILKEEINPRSSDMKEYMPPDATRRDHLGRVV